MQKQKQLIATNEGNFEVVLFHIDNSFVIHIASLTYASYDILTGLLLDETDIQQIYGWITSGDSYVLSRQRLNAHNWGELSDDRSEERRVGKECRSRWSPYH